ncbi:signal peptide containing protein [Theileria equi strain WA]|uniref:Signal peptide containing protein n=1 Tax=Theileria equi strain WA TaxID=1537102 RepID=L1LEB1_THEEQ|nr:signal peptide containing protein [Theileria equi strain WA]EKX73624.1 signal peptide containing protein [Theileria equi strain WA]|eukprot:XP_004833076.1 signal peptide containing protein [Theileria equi strain WA]
MKFHILFSIVTVLQLCRGADDEKSGATSDSNHLRVKSADETERPFTPELTDPVTLDIKVPDPLRFSVFEDNEDEIKHRDFYPESTSFIVSITEGETVIWTAKDGEKCVYAEIFMGEDLNLLGVSVRLAAKVSFTFFEKIDGAWKEISTERFHTIIQGLEERENSKDKTPPASPGESRREGVAKPDTPVVKSKSKRAKKKAREQEAMEYAKKIASLKIVEPGEVTEEYPVPLPPPPPPFHVCNCSFMCSPGAHKPEESKKEDGDLDECTDGLEEVSLDADVFEGPKGATADSSTQHTPSLERRSLGQKKIPLSQTGHGKNPFLPLLDPVTMDICKPDKFLVGVEEDYDGETRNVILEPRDDISVVSITEDGVPIWSASGDEKCTCVEVSIGENYKIVYLDIREEREVVSKCFEKVNGEWKENECNAAI